MKLKLKIHDKDTDKLDGEAIQSIDFGTIPTVSLISYVGEGISCEMVGGFRLPQKNWRRDI